MKIPHFDALAVLANSGSHSGLPGSNAGPQPATDHDILWEREFRQAKQSDFSAWFPEMPAQSPALTMLGIAPDDTSVEHIGHLQQGKAISGAGVQSAQNGLGVRERGVKCTQSHVLASNDGNGSHYGALTRPSKQEVFRHDSSVHIIQVRNAAGTYAEAQQNDLTSTLSNSPAAGLPTSAIPPQIEEESVAKAVASIAVALLPSAEMGLVWSAAPATMFEAIDKQPVASGNAESPFAPNTADGDQDPSSLKETARPYSPPRLQANSVGSMRDPMRLYAEWSGKGVHIWLGVDADSILSLDQLAGQLRQWFANQGAQLRGLVCNGRTVWRTDHAGAFEIEDSDHFNSHSTPPSSAANTSSSSPLHSLYQSQQELS